MLPALLFAVAALALLAAARRAGRASLAAAGVAAALLAALIMLLPAADGADAAIRDWFVPLHRTWAGGVLAWLTRMGDMQSLLSVVLAAAGLLWAARSPLLLPFWLTVAGTQATTWGVKFALDRQRPDFLTAVTADSPSFPSAHAAGTISIWGFVAVAVAWRMGPGARLAVTVLAVLLILAIGASRAVLSVHFATDVAAGWLIGGAWLLAGIAAAGRRRAAIAPPAPLP